RPRRKSSMTAEDEISQDERRAILRNERGGTYYDIAAAEATAVGGRYAARERSTVVGSSQPVAYPAQPSNSPWASDPVGLEPPLGEDLGGAPIVGEAFEVEKSLREARSGTGLKLSELPLSASPGGDTRSLGLLHPESEAAMSPPQRKQRRRHE